MIKIRFNLSKWNSPQNEIQFIPANEIHKKEKIENRYLFDKVDLWDFLEVAILRMVGKQKTLLPEKGMKAFYGQNIEYPFIDVLLNRTFMYRIYSNKRRGGYLIFRATSTCGAYSIFRATSAALIGGRPLCTSQCKPRPPDPRDIAGE